MAYRPGMATYHWWKVTRIVKLDNITSSVILKENLETIYKIVCFEDLGRLSQSRDLIYKIFEQYHQSSYTPTQRLILYAKENIPNSFLDHILKAADLIDISINFILLVSPNSEVIVTNFKQQYSDQSNCFDYKKASVSDATSFSTESCYRIPTTICPMPWINIAIAGDGKMSPCCVYQNKEESYNINLHTPVEYYHSKHMDNLRQSLINGDQPEGCGNCWYRESSGNKSTRQHSLSWYGKKFLCQSTKDTIDHVINLDLDFGNLCNLKCRICNYERSSSIAAEILTKGNKFVNESRNKIKLFNQNAKWIDDPAKLSRLDTIIPNLENIEIEGGEPFLHDLHGCFLNEKLAASDRISDIRIRYSSNATIFPDHTLWPRFKEIQLNLSIDDIGQRFEYQRDNAVWANTSTILDQYKKLDYKNLKLSFWITVSVQNIFYLPEIVDELSTFTTIGA